MKSLTSALAVLALASCSVPAAFAADAAASSERIPILDFARKPKYADIRFSPDGARFAALQEIDGRVNVTVGDLKAGSLTRITSFKTYDVRAIDWISSSRLVLTLTDLTKGLAELKGGGLYAVNADGSEPRELSSGGRGVSFFRRIAGSADEMIALSNERDARIPELYRLNTRTGRKKLLVDQAPGRVARWFLDAKDVPRAAITEDGRARSETFWYRDNESASWRKIGTYVGEEKRMRPATFDADGSLLVFSNLASDTFKLYSFDASTGKPGALLLEHAVADLDEARFVAPVSLGFKVLGMYVQGDKPETIWFEDKFAKLQALIDVSLPKGNVNYFSVLDDGKVSIVSYSDRDPGVYYLYEPTEKRLQEVLRPRDWIQPERMSPTTVIRYKARDGLEIPAYLTVPTGSSGKKLPLVAVIHGGPFGIRDHWGYDPDVQFLASRGYAVLQPNYRGSGGYGDRLYTAGIKQWGQAMQDDITDGVRHLVQQGIVDPARMCIDGTSYGGYAVLMGLIREPDLFKCGIDEAGVSDLFYLSELGNDLYNTRDAAASDAFQDAMVGDPGKDSVMMKANSPRLHADRIKGKLMIVQAMRDTIVPIQHAEGMRDAMRAAGKDVEWVVYPDEAHGFIKLENRVDRYNKIEAFLKKNIGQ